MSDVAPRTAGVREVIARAYNEALSNMREIEYPITPEIRAAYERECDDLVVSTILTALAATTDVEIDAVIKRYGNTAWHQGFASGAKADIPEIEQRAEDRKAAGTMLRTLIAVRGPEARVVDLDTLQREDGEWASRTFPNASNDTIMSHLTEEVEELSNAAHIDNVAIGNIEEEAADCLLLLLHLAHRNHFSLFEEAQKKFEINKKRTWNVKAPGGHTKHDATPEELTHD